MQMKCSREVRAWEKSCNGNWRWLIFAEHTMKINMNDVSLKKKYSPIWSATLKVIDQLNKSQIVIDAFFNRIKNRL